jgi:hypothetical protein
VSGIFRLIASRWSDCTDQRVEILAAGVSASPAKHRRRERDGVIRSE